jgi:hypothetical protein
LQPILVGKSKPSRSCSFSDDLAEVRPMDAH